MSHNQSSHQKSAESTLPYFKPGKKVRYKRNRCSEGERKKIFVVQTCILGELRFVGKSGLFSVDYFEPVK